MWFAWAVILERLGEDPIESTVHQVAHLYWEHHVASTSPSRAQRLRAERGDLAGTHQLIDSALAQPKVFDELVLEMIRQLHADRPVTLLDGLYFLAASVIEEKWNAGDDRVISRLRTLGVSAEDAVHLEAGIWKDGPSLGPPRKKPRHPALPAHAWRDEAPSQ